MRVETLLIGSLAATALGAAVGSSSCKCFPGDKCWPSDNEWKSLNSSVNGRLIKTVPLGSPCHDPTYDGEECQYLQSQWQSPGIQ